ncbi:MAG: DUF305 domain-containing protein [Pseudomonadota bacterium]
MHTPAASRFRLMWQAFALLLVFAGLAHAAAPAPERNTARYEVDFMQDMIDHHAMATMMAMTCESKAVHAELRELCTDIRMSQQQEIAQMQGWLQAWYGIAYRPEMKPGEMRRMERMAQLPPAEYEVEFMQSMIRHHRLAIRRASVCLDRAAHAALVDLCGDIIEVQLDEIRMMEAWLCQWYGICRRTG